MRIGEKLFVIGGSLVFQKAIGELFLLARHDFNVLLEGETGVGKELFARALHLLSPRSKQPFVSINCGALPHELIESELFGHCRGAFTHACDDRTGLVAEAENGTLFLDEVLCLDVQLQAKLLRFLDSGEYRRVGETRARNANLRIVAASNRPLKIEAAEGRFRWDLYYRLATYSLEPPPLRSRREDIAELVEHFIQEFSQRFNLAPPRLSQDALSALVSYSWPGNVRQLQNVISQIMIRKSARLVETVDLPEEVSSGFTAPRDDLLGLSFQEQKSRVVHEFESSYLWQLMTQYHGNVSRAARAAGKHRRALTALLQKHGLDPSCFRRSSAAGASASRPNDPAGLGEMGQKYPAS